MKKVTVGVLPLALALATASCSTTLDMPKARQAISEGLTQQLSLPVSGVTCPEERTATANDTFECVAAISTGGQLRVKVTQKDDEGNIAWELIDAKRLIDLGSLERQVKDGIKEQLAVDAEISCGGKYRVAEPGRTFECSAKSDTSEATIIVTMKDESGNVSWSTGPAK